MGERVTQLVTEPVIVGDPSIHTSQLEVEAIQDAQGNIHLSQATIDAILNTYPGVHISQILLEVVGKFIEVPMPLVYPTLPGIKPNVSWDTEFFNTPEEVTLAGGKIVIGISDTPLHTFTLSYNFLRYDLSWREEQLLRGFFGANKGNLGRFAYLNEKDFRVVGQKIGTTDGTTRIYTLNRDYGVGEASWNEPIGWLNQVQPFKLYFDNTEQDKSTYTIDTTVGAQQQVIFNGTPAAGQDINVDMSYYYYCKFVDPKISIEKFLRGFSSADKIQIESCRPGL